MDHLTAKPGILFLIDSLGALFTASFLLVILSNFNEYFGIPIKTLSYFSFIAACFFLYSTTCFFLLKENWIPFIRAIGISNILYCILTIGLIIVYYPVITIVGMAYFLVEITIIGVLAYIELRVAIAISKNRSGNH